MNARATARLAVGRGNELESHANWQTKPAYFCAIRKLEMEHERQRRDKVLKVTYKDT